MTHAVHPIQWLRSACASVISRISAAESPWQRVPMEVPVTAFGPGSATPFAQYFEDESRVEVGSIDDIVDQFHERDVWQQPSSFERRQRGDCEDFALWAWRKLSEIGVDAEFFVGRVTGGADPAVQRQHAWIVFRVDGDEVLFEPAARDRERMLQPLSVVKDAYVPHFSVDRHFVTCAFVGCLLTL